MKNVNTPLSSSAAPRNFSALLTMAQVTAAETSYNATWGELRRRTMTVLACSQAQLLGVYFGREQDLDGLFDLIDDAAKLKGHLQLSLDLVNAAEARLQAVADVAVEREAAG